MPEVKIRLRQIGPCTSEVTLPRGHTALVDRPEAKGGADRGPMGGEYFLTAVGGCFMSTLLAAVKSRGAAVSNVQTQVTGTLVGKPARFSSVSLEVTSDCEDAEQFERLVQVAENGCIMVQTLKHGVEFGVRVGAVH